MSPTVAEYHLRRAMMERDAASRATCGKARASHLQMAALHAQRANECCVETPRLQADAA